MSEEVNVLGYLHVGIGAAVRQFPSDPVGGETVNYKVEEAFTIDIPKVRNGFLRGQEVYFWHNVDNEHRAAVVWKSDPNVKIVWPLI